MKIINIFLSTLVATILFITTNASESSSRDIIRQKRMVKDLKKKVSSLEKIALKINLPLHFTEQTALLKRHYGLVATLFEQKLTLYTEKAKLYSMQENIHRRAAEHLTALQRTNEVSNNCIMKQQLNEIDAKRAIIQEKRVLLLMRIQQLATDVENITEV